jgi:tetratricopeptide (TPR) repeat protein
MNEFGEVKPMSRISKFLFVALSLLCVLLLWTNAGASQGRADSGDEATELNNQAIDCVNDHHYEQALGLLKKAIALHPNHPVAYYNLGRIYQLRDEWELAI